MSECHKTKSLSRGIMIHNNSKSLKQKDGKFVEFLTGV